jgi:hypothetical protein
MEAFSFIFFLIDRESIPIIWLMMNLRSEFKLTKNQQANIHSFQLNS